MLFSKNSNNFINDFTYNSQKDFYSCTFNGKKRTFILCLPPSYNEQTSLIFMLHGLGGSAQMFKYETNMEQKAFTRNYAVLYLDGTVDPDNISYGNGFHYQNNRISKNDINFMVELAKYCQKEFNLGPKVFAVGFSNGGFMVNKLAATHSDFFTGVASVAGMMPKEVWNIRKIKGKIGFLQINGTKDDVVPMEINNSASYNSNPSIEKVIAYFRKKNNNKNECQEFKLSESVTKYSYGNDVAWILIKDGYHSWPNETITKIDTCSLILDFFDNL